MYTRKKTNILNNFFCSALTRCTLSASSLQVHILASIISSAWTLTQTRQVQTITAITHWPSLWVSQTAQETLVQFHKRVISFISVALGCSVTKTTRFQSGAAGAPPSTHTPGQTSCYCAAERTTWVPAFFDNPRMPYEPEKHTHTWNPRQSESKLTCPQPGALHTKGLSSPIFAKALQCNCGREDENITERLFERFKPGKSSTVVPRDASAWILAQRRKRRVFKNNEEPSTCMLV